MKLSKLIYTLSAVAMTTAMVPAMAVVERDSLAANQNKAVPPVILSWLSDQQTKFDKGLPLDTDLTPEQLAFLNDFMAGTYSSSPEEAKVTAPALLAVIAVLILIIAQDSNDLEVANYNSYALKETMNMGLNTTEANLLFSLTKKMSNGELIYPTDQEFLREIVSTKLEKNSIAATLSWFAPLAEYSAANPEFLSSSEKEKLQEAGWASMGLDRRERNMLTKLGSGGLPPPKLNQDEITALRKFSRFAEIGNFWLIEPPQLLKIQAIMNNNSNAFNPDMLTRFNEGVNRSPSVQQFKQNQGNGMAPNRLKTPQNQNNLPPPNQQKTLPQAPAGPANAGSRNN